MLLINQWIDKLAAAQVHFEQLGMLPQKKTCTFLFQHLCPLLSMALATTRQPPLQTSADNDEDDDAAAVDDPAVGPSVTLSKKPNSTPVIRHHKVHSDPSTG